MYMYMYIQDPTLSLNVHVYAEWMYDYAHVHIHCHVRYLSLCAEGFVSSRIPIVVLVPVRPIPGREHPNMARSCQVLPVGLYM